jgi:DMSO/TMAO reductase YedYZ molybdopterin-dependent catalytic subunit
MISKNPFANEIAPPNDEFKRLQAGGFRDWRLVVDGTVAHPMSFSLAISKVPVRSQITEVACEEGLVVYRGVDRDAAEWVLREAGVLPQTRYVVYLSFEKGMWGSIDMNDAGIRTRC